MSATQLGPALSGTQCSLFRRNEQSFCIDVSHLQEVLQSSQITPAPQAHPALAGVMNLRGEVLPIVLVDAWLRLPGRAYDPSRPILVLRRKELLVGVQVDSVQRVGYIPLSEVLPSPLSSQSAIWSGIWYRDGEKLTTMIDGAALLELIYSEIANPSHNGKAERETSEEPPIFTT